MKKEKKVQFDIYLQDRLFKVVVNYRKKRGVSYYVEIDTIVINSSHLYSIDAIRGMIIKNEARILKKAKLITNNIDINLYQDLLNKEKYLFLGKMIERDLDESYKQFFNKNKDVLINLYNKRLMSLNITNINLKIKPLKSKWGSFSQKNMEITLNLYLLFFEEECIDFVICHEICHIGNLTHNKLFHNNLDKICPNNRILRKKINDLTPLCKKLQEM